MTKVSPTRIGALNAYRLFNSGSCADVLSSCGGAVNRLLLHDSNPAAGTGGDGQEILASPSDEEADRNPWFRGRLLFPFNDRIPRGAYCWNGRELHLPINSSEDNSALHGLVYNRPFSTRLAGDRSSDEAVLHLSTRIRPNEFAGYPFDMTLDATYRLSRTAFALELCARNTGTQAAPVAFGWHPYLTLGVRVDGLTLRTDSTRYVPVDADLLPTGEVLPVNGSPYDFRHGRRIGRDHIDIALSAPSDGLVVLSSARGSIRLMISGDAFSFLQIFTHPDRNSIAVEPITAATNAFNLPQLGLRIVEPGRSISGTATLNLMSP